MQPGGAVRTEELTLPGFRHDTFSAVYPAGAASPVFGRMPLADHGLEWVHPAACAAYPLPDGGAAVLYRDLDATAASLNGQCPRRRRSVGRRSRPPSSTRSTPSAPRCCRAFHPCAGRCACSPTPGPCRALQFARLLPTSAVGLGRRLFESGGARAWLYGAAMHGDAPVLKPGSAIAGAYLNLLGHAVGWPSPRGGAGRLTDALVSYLRSLGGEVRTGTPVERITSASGRTTGVEIATGERVAAPLVIADVMPRELVRLAGEGLARLVSQRAQALRLRPRDGQARLGARRADPVDRRGGPGRGHRARRGQRARAPGRRSRSRASAFRTLRRCCWASRASRTRRAPREGRHTAWAYTHGPARGVDWTAELDRHVERIEAQVERFAPGFRDRILARHVLGPDDLQARNRNLVGGDVGGGSYRLRQVVFRPLPKLSPYRTPLAGLYLGSAATFPGGAVHGVPGDAAARAALNART